VTITVAALVVGSGGAAFIGLSASAVAACVWLSHRIR
jgi:hypothetical protein